MATNGLLLSLYLAAMEAYLISLHGSHIDLSHLFAYWPCRPITSYYMVGYISLSHLVWPLKTDFSQSFLAMLGIVKSFQCSEP